MDRHPHAYAHPLPNRKLENVTKYKRNSQHNVISFENKRLFLIYELKWEEWEESEKAGERERE